MLTIRTSVCNFLFNQIDSDSGSTRRTLLKWEKSTLKIDQVLSLGDVGFLLFFRLVSGDYGKPWDWSHKPWFPWRGPKPFSRAGEFSLRPNCHGFCFKGVDKGPTDAENGYLSSRFWYGHLGESWCVAFIAFVKTQWFGQALPISPMNLYIFISTIRSFTAGVVLFFVCCCCSLFLNNEILGLFQPSHVNVWPQLSGWPLPWAQALEFKSLLFYCVLAGVPVPLSVMMLVVTLLLGGA